MTYSNGRGLRRGQEANHVADLFGVDDAANGDVLGSTPFDFLDRHAFAPSPLGIRWAGALGAGGPRMYQVHVNALGTELIRERLGEMGNGGIAQATDVARLPPDRPPMLMIRPQCCWRMCGSTALAQRK